MPFRVTHTEEKQQQRQTEKRAVLLPTAAIINFKKIKIRSHNKIYYSARYCCWYMVQPMTKSQNHIPYTIDVLANNTLLFLLSSRILGSVDRLL